MRYLFYLPVSPTLYKLDTVFRVPTALIVNLMRDLAGRDCAEVLRAR